MAKETIAELWETIEWLNEELEKTKKSNIEMGRYLPEIPKWLEDELIYEVRGRQIVVAVKKYRSFTGTGIRESREAIRKIESIVETTDFFGTSGTILTEMFESFMGGFQSKG